MRPRNNAIAPFVRFAILLVLFTSSLVVHVVDGQKHNVAWRRNANEQYEHQQNDGIISHGERRVTPWRHFLIPNDRRRSFLMQSPFKDNNIQPTNLRKHSKNNNRPTNTKGQQMKWKGRDQ